MSEKIEEEKLELFAIIHNVRDPATTQRIVDAIIAAGWRKEKKDEKAGG